MRRHTTPSNFKSLVIKPVRGVAVRDLRPPPQPERQPHGQRQPRAGDDEHQAPAWADGKTRNAKRNKRPGRQTRGEDQADHPADVNDAGVQGVHARSFSQKRHREVFSMKKPPDVFSLRDFPHPSECRSHGLLPRGRVEPGMDFAQPLIHVPPLDHRRR